MPASRGACGRCCLFAEREGERVFAPRLFVQEPRSGGGRKGDSFGKQQRLAGEGRSPDWVSVVDLKSCLVGAGGGNFFIFFPLFFSPPFPAPGARDSFSALHEGRAPGTARQRGCVIHPFSSLAAA